MAVIIIHIYIYIHTVDRYIYIYLYCMYIYIYIIYINIYYTYRKWTDQDSGHELLRTARRTTRCDSSGDPTPSRPWSRGANNGRCQREKRSENGGFHHDK